MDKNEKIRTMEDADGFWLMNDERWKRFFESHSETGSEKATAIMSGQCYNLANMPKQGQVFRCEFETSWIFFEVKSVRIPHDPGNQYFANMFPILQTDKTA